MSGHQHRTKLSSAELDDLLDEALADPKIKKRLARGFNLVTSFDIALLGSSSIGGFNVYLDRHLRFKDWPYGILPVRFKKLDTKPGLIRHERLEQALEDEFGWGYDLSHAVAQQWEERYYRAKGFDPEAVERMFEPYIKHDEVERIVKTPLDLDMRPLLAPVRSTAIIKRIEEAAQKEKTPQKVVAYTNKAHMQNQRCALCWKFVDPKYGGPGCVKIQSPIVAGGWCRRFERGKLEERSPNEHQRSARQSPLGGSGALRHARGG